jgi:glutamate synthase (NADPH/NADH) large chain
MIKHHFEYTGSTVAQFILKDFDNQLKNFVKVFPRDYKRVFQQQSSNLPKGEFKGVLVNKNKQ